MSLDISIDFESDMAAFANTQFQIYFLENMPFLGQDGGKGFAQEIYDPTVNGYVIKTVTQPRTKRASSGGGTHNPMAHDSTQMIGITSIGKTGIIDHKAGQTCKWTKI